MARGAVALGWGVVLSESVVPGSGVLRGVPVRRTAQTRETRKAVPAGPGQPRRWLAHAGDVLAAGCSPWRPGFGAPPVGFRLARVRELRAAGRLGLREAVPRLARAHVLSVAVAAVAVAAAARPADTRIGRPGPWPEGKVGAGIRTGMAGRIVAAWLDCVRVLSGWPAPEHRVRVSGAQAGAGPGRCRSTAAIVRPGFARGLVARLRAVLGLRPQLASGRWRLRCRLGWPLPSGDAGISGDAGASADAGASGGGCACAYAAAGGRWSFWGWLRFGGRRWSGPSLPFGRRPGCRRPLGGLCSDCGGPRDRLGVRPVTALGRAAVDGVTAWCGQAESSCRRRVGSGRAAAVVPRR